MTKIHTLTILRVIAVSKVGGAVLSKLFAIGGSVEDYRQVHLRNVATQCRPPYSEKHTNYCKEVRGSSTGKQ